MIQLTTSQAYRSGQFIAGSLSYFTITITDATHKYWEGTVAAGSAVVVGTEYTITDDDNGGNSIDYSGIGGPAAGSAAGDNVGKKFIASAGNVPTGGAVSYGDDEAVLESLVKAIQMRATPVAIGVANDGTNGAGSQAVRVIVENNGLTKEELKKEIVDVTPHAEAAVTVADFVL